MDAIDRLFFTAGGRPLADNALRPLDTIFRRLRRLRHARTSADSDVSGSVDVHPALPDCGPGEFDTAGA